VTDGRSRAGVVLALLAVAVGVGVVLFAVLMLVAVLGPLLWRVGP
jgi:hypothetical protein